MHRSISGHQSFPGADAGGGLYDAADVDGADIRYDFRAVWLVARGDHAGAVFRPGGSGDRERGRAHADRQCILFAATLAWAGRWCEEGFMMRNILVGYDGSEAAVNALSFAAGLARAFGSSLHVLAVVRPPEFGGMVETEALIEQSRQHY